MLITYGFIFLYFELFILNRAPRYLLNLYLLPIMKINKEIEKASSTNKSKIYKVSQYSTVQNNYNAAEPGVNS